MKIGLNENKKQLKIKVNGAWLTTAYNYFESFSYNFVIYLFNDVTFFSLLKVQ